MDRKIKLIWDFYGMDSLKTAEHHLRHLKEFMENKSMELLNSGTGSNADQHALAFITVAEKDVRVLRDALKPNRAFVVA